MSSVPVVEGVPVPVELLDADHVVWHHQGRYRAWMTLRGWGMPASERLGVATHPDNRRRAAAVGWAHECGIDVDHQALRSWWLTE